mmetsp:Transcript_63125/g.199726  ORF Transcript_63125/g.199726 Transcript_63125/m.199726 type:complete len:237 (-) Transcript_63125:215-925(-)
MKARTSLEALPPVMTPPGRATRPSTGSYTGTVCLLLFVDRSQTLTTLSRPPERRRPPQGEMARLVMALKCCLSTAAQPFRRRSQTRTSASSPPEKSMSLERSGWKRHTWTTAECPRSACVQKPLSMSHTRIERSADAVARSVPVGSTSMSATGASWAFHVLRGFSVSRSQRLTCSERLAAKTCLPSGCTAMAVIGSESPASVCFTAPVAISTTLTSSEHAQAAKRPSGERRSAPPV